MSMNWLKENIAKARANLTAEVSKFKNKDFMGIRLSTDYYRQYEHGSGTLPAFPLILIRHRSDG